MSYTPCETPNNDGTYTCPYGEPTSEMCRNCIADADHDFAGADWDEYPVD